jgi:hypothetical protein
VKGPNRMELGTVVSLAGLLSSGLVAVLVAFIVSGRDDRRQRESERRAVQRETIIALQDGWLEMEDLLTKAVHGIQAHQSVGEAHRRESDEHYRRLETDSSAVDQDAWWEQRQQLGDELNSSGHDQNVAVLEVRNFARNIKLLKSRVSNAEVRQSSARMRIAVEAMILDVANRRYRHGEFREKVFEPAYDRFIEAGYHVLADLDGPEEKRNSRAPGSDQPEELSSGHVKNANR